MATTTKRNLWCIRHFRWACQLWPRNFIRVSFFVFQMFHFYYLDLPFSESLQLEQNFKVLPEVGIRLSMRPGIRWDDWWEISRPLWNGLWIPEWAHLLQQSVLEQSFYFSYISWTDSKTRKIHLEIISLKFRFESRQTLFGLILYGFIKRMDGYDPSPRFKIQYCLVYILIPIHYFLLKLMTHKLWLICHESFEIFQIAQNHSYLSFDQIHLMRYFEEITFL